jgi:hypothetical protein
MIVGETFVWAHIPKTGGDATTTMIRQVPRLVVMSDHPFDHAKHLSLDLRRGSIDGKLLAANIRRLPSWAVSYMHHRAQFGLWPDYEPQGRRSSRAVAGESAADQWLADVIGDYEIDFWIRQEHLVDDLVRFLRDAAELTSAEEAAIRSVGLVNEAHSTRFRSWRQSPKRFFSRRQIARLYANNPRWAAIERSVYG